MRRRRMIIAQFMTIDDKAPKRLRRLLKQRRKELRQQRREAASNDKTSAISANTSAALLSKFFTALLEETSEALWRLVVNRHKLGNNHTTTTHNPIECCRECQYHNRCNE
eukprot:TRINITY_DN24781_c0_g1_i1.p2 TRINITY_DN24781_c0_g1~~TRINITY_DN24781_c0_g1_i1.p2  ORF type:complete len:110 (-),score=8.28 TRINITY_DN24781_c0_g1_i1:63-392(-)